MNRYDTPETLTAYWQQSVEIGIEAGQRPLLSLGMAGFQPESLSGWLASARLARRSATLRDPLVLVGGDGDLWWATTLQWSRSRTSAKSPLLWYAGADWATYAASLSIARPPDAAESHMLPAGMAWMLTPTSMPGSEPIDLTFLPCLLADDLFVPAPVPVTRSTWVDQGEMWATLLLVVALLLAAWRA